MPKDTPRPAMILVGAIMHALIPCCRSNGSTSILRGNEALVKGTNYGLQLLHKRLLQVTWLRHTVIHSLAEGRHWRQACWHLLASDSGDDAAQPLSTPIMLGDYLVQH